MVLGDYSCLCAQESTLLVGLKGPYMELGINSGSSGCKKSILPLYYLSDPEHTNYFFILFPLFFRWVWFSSMTAVLRGNLRVAKCQN